MREGRSAQKRIHCRSFLKLNQRHIQVMRQPVPRVSPSRAALGWVIPSAFIPDETFPFPTSVSSSVQWESFFCLLLPAFSQLLKG